MEQETRYEAAKKRVEESGGQVPRGKAVFRYGEVIHSDPKAMVRLMLEAPEYSIVDCARAFRMKA